MKKYFIFIFSTFILNACSGKTAFKLERVLPDPEKEAEKKTMLEQGQDQIILIEEENEDLGLLEKEEEEVEELREIEDALLEEKRLEEAEENQDVMIVKR